VRPTSRAATRGGVGGGGGGGGGAHGLVAHKGFVRVGRVRVLAEAGN
jgi:hypothetical protein